MNEYIYIYIYIDRMQASTTEPSAAEASASRTRSFRVWTLPLAGGHLRQAAKKASQEASNGQAWLGRSAGPHWDFIFG